MTKPIQLPDAMPTIDEPSLLVVCDTHACRFIDVGGRTIVEGARVESKEQVHTDRETETRGPSGITSGTADRNQQEEGRLRSFTNALTEAVLKTIRGQGIRALYFAAPAKIISLFQSHLPKAEAALLKVVIDGNFMKEDGMSLLLRFRPDLAEGVTKLRDQENFSTKKHLPK